MSQATENNIAIGQHGFPASIGNIENLIEVVRANGNALMNLQVKVANGYLRPLQADIETIVIQNPRNVLYTRGEKDIYFKIKAFLSQLSDVNQIGFLAEEEEHSISQKGYWVIDPICNIRDYINGGQEWAISIGFALDGKPTGGVIYYPTKGEFLFTSEDGQSHRRSEGVTSKHETALVRYSSEHDDNSSTLRGVFAKTASGLFKSHNPDIFSNVALMAIASRIEVKPKLNPELPLALIPQ